jgi:hypothetical protein
MNKEMTIEQLNLVKSFKLGLITFEQYLYYFRLLN